MRRASLRDASLALMLTRPDQVRDALRRGLDDLGDHLRALERSVVAPSGDPVPSTAPRQGPLDMGVLEEMGKLASACASNVNAVAPSRLRPIVSRSMNDVAESLDRPSTPVLRARLGSVLSETALVAGWLAQLSGQRADAHAC